MMIKDYIVEMGLEVIKNKVISMENRKKIEVLLENFVEQQQQVNMNCTLKEEIDFANLAWYICNKLPDDVEMFLFGEKNEREISQVTIAREARRYAQSDTIPASENTVKMVETAIKIIRDFYRSQMDWEWLFAATQIEDTISSDIEQKMVIQQREIGNLIQKSEKSILMAINAYTSMGKMVNSEYKKEDSLPHNLTKSIVSFANERTVIHRDYELQEIECLLKEKKIALLLSGFGGIGKSALARVLYAKSSDWFDCVGWVEYHKNLKNSFLASMDMNDEIIDQEKRWKLISTQLKNSPSSKIIFIDNVDYDAKQGQNPQNDLCLQEITGWTNVTIVLTSRMKEFHGYQTYPIRYIGNDNKIESCADLFYLYYDKNEYNKSPKERRQYDLVKKLIALADYHTYTIELLARSAIYEENLSVYLEKIEKLGFKFPSLKVSTDYNNDSVTVAEQLRILFNMQSRTRKERQILWDFSVLPEGTILSHNDVTELLAYSINDLHHLCQEGWLLYESGQGFYIHPLVREVIFLGLKQGKAPYRTLSHLIGLVCNRTLITDSDSQAFILRKLYMIEIAEKYIAFKSEEKLSDFYYCLGTIEFKTAHKKLTSIAYLEKALLHSNNLNLIANIRYQLGYVKSATHQYREMAKEDLLIALEIWESFESCEYEIAMVYDHLGYILMDSKLTYNDSEKYLKKAMCLRKAFVESSPTEKNLRAYATTCDNLGYLLYKSSNEINESWSLLEEALSIRERLYESSNQYAAEVAWTYFNLGQLLSKNSQYYDKAETYLRKSLDIRRILENLHPQMYTTNIVFTLISLAKIVSKDIKRHNEAKQMIDEAIALKSGIELNYVGFFPDEVEADIQALSAFLKL